MSSNDPAPQAVCTGGKTVFFGIWLAVLGVLGASSLIIAKKPEAKELIGKLAPFQGWIGAISALWGAWGIISCLLNIGYLGRWPIYWVSWLAASILLFALGLLLGVGVLKTFIKNPQANEKMDQTIARLAPYQGNLGLAAIALGVWTVVSSIVFFG
jgi:hypothetical protein